MYAALRVEQKLTTHCYPACEAPKMFISLKTTVIIQLVLFSSSAALAVVQTILWAITEFPTAVDKNTAYSVFSSFSEVNAVVVLVRFLFQFGKC